MITNDFDLSNFSFIKIEGDWKVDIQSGKDFLVDITADKEFFKSLVVEVQDETLLLGSLSNINFKDTVVANIHLPVLQQVEAFGKCNIIADNLSNKDIAITLNGGCNAQLSGIVESLTADISGSCMLNAIALACVKADVTINGTSIVKTSAMDILNVNIQGDGIVEYSNDPEITQNIYGKGKVVKTTA